MAKTRPTTAQIWGAASARKPRGRAPHGFQQAGGQGFRGRGRPGGGRASAAAAERAAHRELPLTSARPRTCPWAARSGAPSREGTRPLSSALPGSACGARRPGPETCPRPPRRPRARGLAGQRIPLRAARRGSHATARRPPPPAPRLPLSPKVRRANYCKLKLIKLLFPFPSPWEHWRDPAPGGGLTQSGHPAGRREGPGEGEAPVPTRGRGTPRGLQIANLLGGLLSKLELFRFF